MTDQKEFWPDPWLDYDEHQQKNGNKPLSVLLAEMVAALGAMIPCEFLDNIQGTNTAEWRCPQCETVYTSVNKAYCNCKMGGVAGDGYRAAEIVGKFLDEPAAELLDRGCVLDKGTCMAHHTDAMGVKRARKRLFSQAAEKFVNDRTIAKLGE